MTLNLLKQLWVLHQYIDGLLNLRIHFHVLPNHAVFDYHVNVRLVQGLPAELHLGSVKIEICCHFVYWRGLFHDLIR